VEFEHVIGHLKKTPELFNLQKTFRKNKRRRNTSGLSTSFLPGGLGRFLSRAPLIRCMSEPSRPFFPWLQSHQAWDQLWLGLNLCKIMLIAFCSAGILPTTFRL